MPTKVAFLLLDDIHHVHHVAPTAFELSQSKQYQCVIYLQSHSLALVQKIALMYPQQHCQLKILSPSLFRRIISFWRRGICSARRLIHQQATELLTYDALVTPDFNLAWLIGKARAQIKKRPLFFLTFHSCASSRTRPYHLLQDYDFVFLCGQNRFKEFAQTGFLKENGYAITGYNKFDLMPADFKPKLFANDRPVILYNPHFDLTISSWQPWGLAILEYFYQNKDYNFILAPHCNLFRRHSSLRKIPRKYFSASHMIIDSGSEKSVDMTYLQGADIYLGDVSSQVFEFIRRPRPCLFLNPHQLDKANYPYWDLGWVINNFDDFAAALTQSQRDKGYIKRQQKYFAEIFSLNEQSSAARAAAAIRHQLTQYDDGAVII